MSLILALLGVSVLIQAEQPKRSPGKLQQQFDAASTAAAEGRCGDAIRLFTQLEQNPAARKGLVKAAISVRKGECLIFRGDYQEGEAAIREALPVLEKAGTSFDLDVRQAYGALAVAAKRRFDYDTAIRESERLLALSTGAETIKPHLLLASLKRFDRDGAAERHANAALQALDGRGDSPKANRELRATILTEQARAALASGRKAEAYALLRTALSLQGGLTSKTSITEVSTRGDLALAAEMNGANDKAREYLAYTGAGRIREAPFTSATIFEPPLCGLPGGPTRDDYAVIEFGVHDGGWVSYAEPIYVTGGREMALAFARAASNWAWRPENISKVPLFYRAATRVELRCSEGGDRVTIGQPLADAVDTWLSVNGAAAPSTDVPDAKLLDPMRALAADPSALPVKKLRALIWLGETRLIDNEEAIGHLDAAAKVAKELNAPSIVVAKIGIARAEQKIVDQKLAGFRKELRAMLKQADLAEDALVASTLRLRIAAPGSRQRPPEDAAALLDAVIATNGLGPEHPLRINALLQRANIAAAAGDTAKAQANLEATGLSEQQCATVGAAPALKGAGFTYPSDALVMGFEGWVRLEFDVDAKGKTYGHRALIAYPPLMFGRHATEMARTLRYEASYREEEAVACSATQQTIVFGLPH